MPKNKFRSFVDENGTWEIELVDPPACPTARPRLPSSARRFGRAWDKNDRSFCCLITVSATLSLAAFCSSLARFAREAAAAGNWTSAD